MAGERFLLPPVPDSGPPGETPLATSAQALVAVGAMTPEAAQAILDDYDLALSYRAGEDDHSPQRGRAPPAARQATLAPTLGPLRAVRCGRLIERPWGQLFLSYVVLSDEVTTLHVFRSEEHTSELQ